MASPAGLTCLLRESADYRWALGRVLEYLEPMDAMRLTITALEYGDSQFRDLLHWLMDGDTPAAQHSDFLCMLEAAKLGCWEAAAALGLREDRMASPRSPDWDVSHLAAPGADSALRRAMVVVMQANFEYTLGVLKAVAARGDLAAVQCMLLGEFDSVVSNRCRGEKRNALCAAAEAGQFHVTDWLETYSCGCGDCNKIGMLRLVSQLARRGDLERLKEVRARGASNGWNICTNGEVVKEAIRNDNMELAQWVFDARGDTRVDQWTVFDSAAAHGQLEMFQWLSTQWPMSSSHPLPARAAVQHGRLDILRWLKNSMDEARWVWSEWELPRSGTDLDIIRFFHEERGIPPRASFTKCFKTSTSVESVQYVLDRVDPTKINGAQFLLDAADRLNLDVVRYLALERGFWSPAAFACVVKHVPWPPYRRPVNGFVVLEISRFLYDHAKARAVALSTPLDTQISFSGLSILAVAVNEEFATARWLANFVPEVDTGVTLDCSSFDHRKPFPHTLEARRVIIACLHARPSQCLDLEWLPEWAVEANCFTAFSMLVDIGHPGTSSMKIYRRITRGHRDWRFMNKLMTANGLDTGMLPRVVPWAAGIGALGILDLIDRHWGTALRSLDSHSMLDAALQAVRHNQVWVLEWIHTRGLVSPRTDDHTACRDSTVDRLVREAVTYDCDECLCCLVETLAVPTSVLAHALHTATSLCNPRVVRWLTHHVAPSTRAR